jgi:hypothetical protein
MWRSRAREQAEEKAPSLYWAGRLREAGIPL